MDAMSAGSAVKDAESAQSIGGLARKIHIRSATLGRWLLLLPTIALVCVIATRGIQRVSSTTTWMKRNTQSQAFLWRMPCTIYRCGIPCSMRTDTMRNTRQLGFFTGRHCSTFSRASVSW